MKTAWIVVLTGMVLVVVGAQAQTDPNQPQSLQDYLRIAAQNNSQIKAVFHGWRQAVEQIPQARTLDDPKLSYQVEGLQDFGSSAEQTFLLTQMFPWFGVLDAREEEASALAKAARKSYESALLTLARDVKEAFFTFHYLARSVEITRDNVSLVRHFEQVARGRYAAAAAAHPDVIRSQIEVAMLEDRLRGLEQLRPAVVAKLNAILNRPAESPLDWPRPEPYAAVTVEFAPLFAGMLKQNPDLIALEHRIAAMRSRETLAQSKSKPNFELGFGFKDLAEPSSSMGSSGSDDPLMAMISISLPIWSESYAAARRAARSERLQVVHEKIQLENTLGSQIKQALYELQDADRRIVLYRDTVLPKAQEMLVSSEMAYQAGTIDFLSLIDAQRSILQFRLEYEELLANNGKALAELEMLAGGSLTGKN
jgi:outer membrane protein, heavy metal efflux system